jgi:hypothetical protein
MKKILFFSAFTVNFVTNAFSQESSLHSNAQNSPKSISTSVYSFSLLEASPAAKFNEILNSRLEFNFNKGKLNEKNNLKLSSRTANSEFTAKTKRESSEVSVSGSYRINSKFSSGLRYYSRDEVSRHYVNLVFLDDPESTAKKIKIDGTTMGLFLAGNLAENLSFGAEFESLQISYIEIEKDEKTRANLNSNRILPSLHLILNGYEFTISQKPTVVERKDSVLLYRAGELKLDGILPLSNGLSILSGIAINDYEDIDSYLKNSYTAKLGLRYRNPGQLAVEFLTSATTSACKEYFCSTDFSENQSTLLGIGFEVTPGHEIGLRSELKQASFNGSKTNGMGNGETTSHSTGRSNYMSYGVNYSVRL